MKFSKILVKSINKELDDCYVIKRENNLEKNSRKSSKKMVFFFKKYFVKSQEILIDKKRKNTVKILHQNEVKNRV